MTQFSRTPKLVLGKAIGIQWIVGNTLAHGVGISLPIFAADWMTHLGAAPDYISYIITAFATFGIWVGVAQWLLLRQIVPLPKNWILITSLAPMIATILPLSLTSISPFFWLLLLITYPLGLSVSQWTLLRRLLPSSWEWGVTNAVAIIVSLITGLLVGMLSHLSLQPQSSLSVLMGSLSYGMVYGLISYIGLHRLTQHPPVSSPQRDTGLDLPPNAQSWKVQMLPGVMFIATWALWILFVLPKSSTRAMEQFNAMPPGIGLLVMCASMFGYLYISILIHELGHLLFALTQGYELQVFAVDRWGVVRRGERWEIFKTQKRFAGGFVIPRPKSLKVLSKRSLMMMFFGGPLASFLLFIVSASPLLFPSLMRNHLVFLAIALLAGINLYTAIFNILPLALGYIRTDGRRLLDLAQNNLQGKRATAIYAYYASIRQGMRPHEINLALIEHMLAIPEQSTDHILGLLLAYAVALDKGEHEKAGDYLDEALKSHLYLPEIFRGELLLEGTYFEAHIRQRAALARQWFEKIEERALLEPAALLRAEAALQLAEGNLEAARVLVQKGLAKAKSDRFMKGMAMVEEERLQAIGHLLGA